MCEPLSHISLIPRPRRQTLHIQAIARRDEKCFDAPAPLGAARVDACRLISTSARRARQTWSGHPIDERPARASFL